jgi:hypothetical protein
MSYYGSWKIDDLLTFACNTHSVASGAATDADAVPSYRVYEDETGTPILTGNTALLDSANTAGFYSEQITLSAANGFEKGKSYTIYISATVGGVVGTMHHNFQVEAEVDANAVSNIGANVITATAINADAITAAKIATGAIDADALAADAANEVADALLDRTAGVETGVTPRQGLRLMLAALAGKLSGAATATVSIRDTGDSKDRIVATVDADGNRTAVTLDGS